MARAAVYLRAADALSSAGRGLQAMAQACLATQPPIPDSVEFRGPFKQVRLPYFRLPPAADGTDERLFQIAQSALTRAGLPEPRQRRIALFLATSSGPIGALEREFAQAWPQDAGAFPIRVPDQSSMTTRLHSRLGLEGASYTFSTACSASANALLYASWMLREGRIDDALVVGVEFENKLTQQGFFSLMLTAADHSRPFDRDREGIVLGEGVSAAVLSREPLAPGAWQILGGATQCDTAHPTTPTAERIAHTMRGALDDSGLAASDITAIKAHGTGTRSNDLAEGLGLRTVFGERPPAFTTLKPALGHTLGACGLLETLAFTACLERGLMPPTHHFHNADPELGIAPLDRAQAHAGGPVLLNFFGFGGNNCGLVLQPERRP